MALTMNLDAPRREERTMAQHSAAGRNEWAAGGLIFAGTMMVVLGIWQVLVGFAAIWQDAFFETPAEYAYDIDVAAWGWIHLILGIVVFLAGLGVFSGAGWARAIGILLAALSAIAHFLFIPYFPLWSIIVVALAVFVIWALATARVYPEPQRW
jgi:hypothetical protein